MALKCNECGHIFDDCERAIWREAHGEMWSGCPICRGSYDETKQCKICGGEFLEDELLGGCACEDCVEERKRDFKTCYAIAETTDKKEIKINALLASLVGVSKIEAVLYHILKEAEYVDCSAFINQDKDWFADKLAEEVSK